MPGRASNAASALAAAGAAESNARSTEAACSTTTATPAAATAADPQPAATVTPATTQQQPQFADDDPDSPYYIDRSLDETFMPHMIDCIMVQEFQSIFFKSHYVRIPAAPATAADAAQLQAQIDQSLSEGRLHETLPWQCMVALYEFTQHGSSDQRSTLQAVHGLVTTQLRCGAFLPELMLWLLPRLAKEQGLGHADTRELMLHAVMFLYDHPTSIDRQSAMARAVTNVARHIPGRLGWGTAVVAPVADMGAYDRHTTMQEQAHGLFCAKQYKMAKDTAERCVTYYGSMGQHWLACARKASCTLTLANSVSELKDTAGAEKILMNGQKTARLELGAKHPMTLKLVMQYAEVLLSRGYTEKVSAGSNGPLHTCKPYCQAIHASHTCKPYCQARTCPCVHMHVHMSVYE